MEIIFNCPHCEQELSVDSDGAGSEIPCPTCGVDIVIPEKSAKPAPVGAPAGGNGGGEEPRLAPSAIASSAAAKIEMHLKVPVHSTPGASLIKKPAVPFDAVAKGTEKQIRIKTMRHDKCIESGHDKFDEMVTKVLGQIGEANIVGIHPIYFEHFDVQTQKVMTDYGIIIVYRG